MTINFLMVKEFNNLLHVFVRTLSKSLCEFHFISNFLIQFLQLKHCPSVESVPVVSERITASTLSTHSRTRSRCWSRTRIRLERNWDRKDKHTSVIDSFKLNKVWFLSSVRYPPYTDRKITILKMLLKKRAAMPTKYLGYALIFGLGVATTLLATCLMKVNGHFIFLRV